MKNKLIVIGIALIVIGAISVSFSRLLLERREAESFESVISLQTGQSFSNHIELNLEGEEKYRLLWYGPLTDYYPQNSTLEVKDPNGNTLYSTRLAPPPNHEIDFWANQSGIYTIHFNYVKIEDGVYNIYKFIGTTAAYPHQISLSLGLLLVVSGTVVTVIYAIKPSKKLKT